MKFEGGVTIIIDRLRGVQADIVYIIEKLFLRNGFLEGLDCTCWQKPDFCLKLKQK